MLLLWGVRPHQREHVTTGYDQKRDRLIFLSYGAQSREPLMWFFSMTERRWIKNPQQPGGRRLDARSGLHSRSERRAGLRPNKERRPDLDSRLSVRGNTSDYSSYLGSLLKPVELTTSTSFSIFFTWSIPRSRSCKTCFR